MVPNGVSIHHPLGFNWHPLEDPGISHQFLQYYNMICMTVWICMVLQNCGKRCDLVAGQLVAGSESTLVGPAGNSAFSVFPCGAFVFFSNPP